MYKRKKKLILVILISATNKSIKECRTYNAYNCVYKMIFFNLKCKIKGLRCVWTFFIDDKQDNTFQMHLGQGKKYLYQFSQSGTQVYYKILKFHEIATL